MKINKILCALALGFVTLMTACDTDATGSIYDGMETGQGFSFATNTMRAVSVKATAPEFEVPVFRSNSHGDYSGTLVAKGTIDGEVANCYKVSGFTFKDGESQSAVKVDVSELEIGKVLALTLAFTDTVNMGYTNNEVLTVNVNVDYNWLSLGNGTFTDKFFGFYSEPEILKAEGFDRYRVMAPCEAYRTDPANASDDWIASWSAEYIELWVEDGFVFWDAWFTGQNYDGDPKSPIYAYHPSDFSSLNDPEFWTFSKFVDSKTIQLAPYYYVDGMGGWNYTQKDDIVTITLP